MGTKATSFKRNLACLLIGVSCMFPAFTAVAADQILEGFSFEAQGSNVSQNIAHALMEKQAAIVIDVRTPEEYANGHIEGAYNLELDGLAANPQLKILQDANVPVLVYCRSGRRSSIAAEIMSKMDINPCLNFGGVLTWEYGFTQEEPSIPLAEAVKQIKPL